MWDTGRLNPGQAGSFTFTTAGTFAYHCAIHPQMHGTIVVGSGGTAGQPAASQSSSGAGYGQPSYASGQPYYGNNYMNGYGGYGYPGMGYPGSYGPQYPYGMPYPYPPYPSYPPYPPVPPAGQLPAPTGLAVTGMTSTTVTLTWAPVPGAVSYQVHGALTPITSGTQTFLTGLTSTTATVMGLTPNTTYYFHVHAVDARGALSRNSNLVTAHTTP
jgi:hypothetical protein